MPGRADYVPVQTPVNYSPNVGGGYGSREAAIKAAISALPPEMQELVKSGALIPNIKQSGGVGQGGSSDASYEANGFTKDLGDGTFNEYDPSGKFVGVGQSGGGGDFLTRFIHKNGENLLNAGILAGGAALLGGANFGGEGLLGGGGGDALASGALEGGASGIESILTAGSAPGAELAATTGAADLASAGGIGSLGSTVPSINEMIAAGMAPGSAGAAGAASGVLTGEALAAAGGVGSAGLGALGAAGSAVPSINEMVASGMGPGSAGAAGAASGALTGDALAAASGVGTATSLTAAQIAQGLKDAKAAADLLKAAGVGAGAVALGKGLTGGGGNSSYQGTVPKYTASRTQKPVSETRAGIDGKPYRPGQGGVTYFSPMVYTPVQAAAKGGLMGLASGGEIGNEAPQFNISLNTDQGNNYPVQGYPSRDGGVEQNGITQSSLPQTSGLQSLYGPSMQGFNSGGAIPGQSNLGSYSDGGRLLKGPGDGVSDSIPAIIGQKQPARLATGEFVIPARIVSELGNGSTEAGAQRLYEMMDRIQKTRRKTKNVAANTNAAKYLPA
jgi:hypothetical protein